MFIFRILQHIRRNAVAYLALFFALTGASYATWLAPANSVNSAAIIDGQVATPDLAQNAIRADENCGWFGCYGSKEIANWAVGTSELAPGAVGSRQLQYSAVGNGELAADAVTGDKVKDGSLTAADIAGGIPRSEAYIARNDADTALGYGGTTVVSVSLPAGYYALTAETTIFNNETDWQGVTCALSTGATTHVNIPAWNAGGAQSVVVEDLLTLTSPGTASLNCETENGNAQHAKLIAVKVAALHG
jgi:hypothetical protein